MLNKDECLFERDENGVLLGKSVILELLEDKPEVVVKPLPRGKLMRIYNLARTGTPEEQDGADASIIIEGLVSPVFTKEEIINMKPHYAAALTTAILSISLGKGQTELNNENALLLEETALKK